MQGRLPGFVLALSSSELLSLGPVQAGQRASKRRTTGAIFENFSCAFPAPLLCGAYVCKPFLDRGLSQGCSYLPCH